MTDIESKVMMLGNRPVGEGCPVFIVAEIGVNFNGDLGLAKSSINVAADCGADAVKFQTFHADEFVADKELSYTYELSDGQRITESQHAMFKRLELPASWHKELKEHAERTGVVFLSSSADRKAVDLLSDLGVPALKLASEDLVNMDLIEHAASKNLPVILSTGMADEPEIERAVSIFRKSGNAGLMLLHCVSSYPTSPDECNLKRIVSLKNRFALPVGFSDHTEGCDAPALATALGACLIEKHFTLDRNLPGPDHKISADPAIFSELARRVRTAEAMLGTGELTYSKAERKGRDEFRRSIVAKQDISAGDVISMEKLAYKRPGNGLKPYERDLILGKRAVRNIAADEKISKKDVEE